MRLLWHIHLSPSTSWLGPKPVNYWLPSSHIIPNTETQVVPSLCPSLFNSWPIISPTKLINVTEIWNYGAIKAIDSLQGEARKEQKWLLLVLLSSRVVLPSIHFAIINFSNCNWTASVPRASSVPMQQQHTGYALCMQTRWLKRTRQDQCAGEGIE